MAQKVSHYQLIKKLNYIAYRYFVGQA